MRRHYMLTPLELELYQLDENGFLEREPEFYCKPDIVSTLLESSDEQHTTNEELHDIVSLNPSKLFKITKTYNAKNELINQKTEYLYQELIRIYDKKFGKFKNYYGTCLIDNSQKFDRKQFNDGLILKLNYYLNIVDKQWYIVYKNDTDSLNLIKEFLQKIILWVQEVQSLDNSKIIEFSRNEKDSGAFSQTSLISEKLISEIPENLNPTKNISEGFFLTEKQILLI